MKILYLVEQFNPDSFTDIEVFTYELCLMMQKNGYNVKIITCFSSYNTCNNKRINKNHFVEFIYKGIPILNLDGKEFQIKVLKDLIRKENPDVIHVEYPFRTIELIKVTKELGIPYVLNLCDKYLINEHIKAIDHSFKDIFFSAKKVIALNLSVKKSYEKYFQDLKITILHEEVANKNFLTIEQIAYKYERIYRIKDSKL